MATETTTAATVSGGPAATVLNHSVKPYTFTFSSFLRETYQVGLPVDRPICKAYQTGSCPNGTRCTERHVVADSSSHSKHAGGGHGHHHHHPTGGLNSLVCKHWLRGLCKKGVPCEFLHEYNLRKMPECNFFMRNGYCSNGEECLYLHVDPLSKLPPCPHYDMGFCPLGPVCAKKHVRRKLCAFYLAGFCPEGPECRRGSHPKWSTTLDRPTVKPPPKSEEELRADMELLQQQHQAQQQQARGHYDDADGSRDKEDRFGGRHGGRGGGRGGWRGGAGGGGGGGGRGRFRGRGGY
ncbi:high-affinity glucose transporter, putative [Cordyceps militaris CM01]|uniref:mRNA 3'-end-processing protein n=2 Tax=Cordyceps militaris TaxID=73501 RepID=G3JNS4_CORMM|nr:high-affinity glucose transporter, putative [Cordyceps militaris CM01]ATY64894.1 high-affinity glucose [Cordyceps militaris]EGX89914.1 high-affinity glucose transporter, putative [Cordyceps militaris CM01]